MELLENMLWNTILIAAEQSMFKIYTMENKAKNGTYKMMGFFFLNTSFGPKDLHFIRCDPRLIVLPLGVTMTGNKCNWRSSLTMVTKRRRESQLQYIIKWSKVLFSHAFPIKNQISNARLSTFEE